MQPNTLYLPYLLLLPFMPLPNALARRGGGGGGGDDSGSSDSSTGGGSSNDGDSCKTPKHPTVRIWDLIPYNVENYTSGGIAYRDTSYDGSFFKGEGSLHYTITDNETCSRTRQDSAENPIKVLGYAWIGPQAPYPVGPVNPIVIGFKVWESHQTLSKIWDSYGYIQWDEDHISCPGYPDLFSVTTTYGWVDWDAQTAKAMDVVNMTIAEAPAQEGRYQTQDRVQFNATMPEKLNHDTGWQLRLPGRICSRHRVYWFKTPPESLVMNGSFTNSTFDLTLSGSGYGVTDTYYLNKQEYALAAEFRITFSGVFDGDNSTEKLSLHQPDQPLVAWVENVGVHVGCLGWVTSLICAGAIMILI